MKMQRDYYAKSYRKNISDVNMMDIINSFLENTRIPHSPQNRQMAVRVPF